MGNVIISDIFVRVNYIEFLYDRFNSYFYIVGCGCIYVVIKILWFIFKFVIILGSGNYW